MPRVLASHAANGEKASVRHQHGVTEDQTDDRVLPSSVVLLRAALQHICRTVMRNNKMVVICSQMPQPVKDNLLAAFRYLLKPLVRLAVKNAVAFPEFGEALKQAYVDVAAK